MLARVEERRRRARAGRRCRRARRGRGARPRRRSSCFAGNDRAVAEGGRDPPPAARAAARRASAPATVRVLRRAGDRGALAHPALAERAARCTARTRGAAPSRRGTASRCSPRSSERPQISHVTGSWLVCSWRVAIAAAILAQRARDPLATAPGAVRPAPAPRRRPRAPSRRDGPGPPRSAGTPSCSRPGRR